jgi:BolA family transcriptional regulator, general stress-responsive regulator
MSVAGEIRRRLDALAPVALQLVDESGKHVGHAGAAPGGNTHWKLTIVSAAFAGKPTVARHRMVYQALGDLMQHPIHALAITAKAPGEAGAPASPGEADAPASPGEAGT